MNPSLRGGESGGGRNMWGLPSMCCGYGHLSFLAIAWNGAAIERFKHDSQLNCRMESNEAA